jgi:phenylacetate-CoA ligase
MDSPAEVAAHYRRIRRAARIALAANVARPGFARRGRTVRRLAAALAAPPSATRRTELLRHAALDSPYYHHALRATGHDPAAPPAIERWPVLTKADLQASFPDLITRSGADRVVGRGTLLLSRTSGSSGNPTSHLKLDEREAVADIALLHLLLGEHGVPLRGTLLDLGLHQRDQPTVDLYTIAPRGYVSWNLQPFFADDTDAGSFLPHAVQIARLVRPDWIWGLPSRIVQLAHVVADLPDVRLRPKVVVTSYEPLMPDDRATIAHAFGAPVVSLYGSQEAGYCAWECAERRFHFPRNKVHVEIVDAAGTPSPAGETGRLLVTPLAAWLMPLIRYDTGDLGALATDACACGSTEPALARLEGRQTSVILTRSGTKRSPYSILSAIDALGIGSYQVVQEELGALRLVTGTTARVSAGQVDAVERAVAGYLREPCSIRVDPSGEFVLAPSGKKNPIVQLLPT